VRARVPRKSSEKKFREKVPRKSSVKKSPESVSVTKFHANSARKCGVGFYCSETADFRFYIATQLGLG